MTNPRIAAAQALLPILSPFEEVIGKPLRAVRKFLAHDMTAGIALNFGSTTLLIEAISDDDTVAISTGHRPAFVDDEIDVSDKGPWRELIGQSFCWGWVTINQQGYIDGALLSFSDIFPRILVSVIASELKVGVVNKVIA
jgi:hypothetical protein